jgi:LacI family transcriptional regulator
MSATLNDIARATQTSVSTVSRVLADGPVSQRISTQTRARVKEAALQLGYKPNLLARSLRTRKSHTVALLVSDIANPFFGRLASLIEQSLRGHGYSLVLCNSGEDPELEKEYLTLLPQKGIDGLILVPILRTKKALRELIPEKLPVVVVDRPIQGISACVWSDQDQLSQLVADALDSAGVKRIVLVCGPQHVVTHRKRAEYMETRFEVVGRQEGPAQPETGRLAALHWLEKKPDAFVCTNNFLGQGVIESIGELERPPVVAMVDELSMIDGFSTPIVTARQDVPMLAETSVSLLLPQLKIDGGRVGEAVLTSRLVVNRAFQARVKG